jgi:autotransporter-associated beta strand protein
MSNKSTYAPSNIKPIFHMAVIFLAIACTGANAQVVVSSDTSSAPAFATGQSYTINSGVTVTNNQINITNPITAFVNNGSLISTGNPMRLYGTGTITGGFQNNGIITSSGSYGTSFNTSTVSNSTSGSPAFSNTGAITAATDALNIRGSTIVGGISNSANGVLQSTSTTSGIGAAVFINNSSLSSSVDVFNNVGNVFGLTGLAVSSAVTSIPNTNAKLTTLNNSGNIISTTGSAVSNLALVANSNGLGNSQIGSGAMSSGYGIWVNGNTACSTCLANIETINNTGTISSLISGGAGILVTNGGSITTLNNSQGAGNAAGALTYQGKLPTNYNIIVNSASNYGQLSVNGASSGVMNLNISNTSTLAAGTYSSVLSGFAANGLSSASVVSLTSNITDSANKVWYYSFNNASGTYNLVVAGATQTVSTNGLSVTGLALSGLGSTIANKLDGGVFVVDGTQSKSNNITLTSNGGTIDLAGNSATLSGVISDQTTGGKLVVSNSGTAGSGSLVLSGTNTYTGGTTVNAGANLSISSANNLGTGDLNLVGTSTTSATLTTTADMTINNVIKVTADPTFNVASGTTTTATGGITDGASAGDVVVTGGGTLALTAANTYTGLTTVNSGSTLALTGSGSVANSSGVANNGTFNISGITPAGTSVAALSGSGSVALGAKTLTVTNGSGTFSGAIGGTGGSLVVSGGTQTLSGNNTYTGGTTISNGSTLALTGAGSLVATGGVTNNGTLNLSSTTPYAGIISGTGNLVASGGVQSTLTGANEYTGLTTINSGSTLALAGAGSIATTPPGSGVVANNGTFNIQGATAPSVSVNSYSGSGTLATSISASNTTTPKLIVNGTATLTGGLVSVYANPGSYIGGTKYTLVNAAGGVTGKFSNSFVALTGGTTMLGRLSYDALYVYLTLGPSPSDTQQSLTNSAAALRNTFTLQNSVLANSFSYDCTEFGANGICISAGGRNTAVSAANGLNNTSALLIAAYRPHPNYRIGAYADQNLSLNNAGSTVNLGNNTPLIGLFGAWNERVDGTGAEIKVSAAYGQKNATVTRQVVGTSEPGSGGANLTSQGAQITAKYGFTVLKDMIVAPYAGVRYTQNNMGGYTEGTSATVTAPLTYSRLNTNATTALAGLGASYQLTPVTMLFASAGVESDTNTANGSYSATSPYIPGLTPINFNASPVKTRPTAMLGAYYDVVKNQRLGVTGIYRQEPYQGVSTTSVMATYTVGL